MQNTISPDNQTRGLKTAWHIFWHFLFWLGMISLFIFLARMNDHITFRDLIVIFLIFPAINIGLFYINFLVYIPRFLDKKRYWAYACIVLVTIIIFGVIKYGVGLAFKDVILMRNKGHEVSFSHYFFSTVFTSLIFFFLSTVLKFTTDWFLNERIQRDLENQRLTAELVFTRWPIKNLKPHPRLS
jgi:two-component system LytT family sensor kinase